MENIKSFALSEGQPLKEDSWMEQISEDTGQWWREVNTLMDNVQLD